jgi:hypothetical protein
MAQMGRLGAEPLGVLPTLMAILVKEGMLPPELVIQVVVVAEVVPPDKVVGSEAMRLVMVELGGVLGLLGIGLDIVEWEIMPGDYALVEMLPTLPPIVVGPVDY